MKIENQLTIWFIALVMFSCTPEKKESVVEEKNEIEIKADEYVEFTLKTEISVLSENQKTAS